MKKLILSLALITLVGCQKVPIAVYASEPAFSTQPTPPIELTKSAKLMTEACLGWLLNGTPPTKYLNAKNGWHKKSPSSGNGFLFVKDELSGKALASFRRPTANQKASCSFPLGPRESDKAAGVAISNELRRAGFINRNVSRKEKTIFRRGNESILLTGLALRKSPTRFALERR